MRQDDALLLDMWIAARKIQDFTKNASFDDFKTNTMMQSAVLREIQVIGEAARIVSEDAQTRYSGIPWRVIAGMRNRVIHEYFDIRLNVIWAVVQTDIPDLLLHLHAVLPPPKIEGDS
jgi:uncharacterized protein with HEPN domain